MSLAVTKRKKSIIVLAWIAPIVAILISVSMVYDHFNKIGNGIQITFKNIDGLDLRQSHIQFNGLEIGDLETIQIDKNNINRFIVTATIYSDYNYLIKEGSIFYKVSPKVSLTEVSGLSNVLKGNYIELIPASTNLNKLKNLKNQTNFVGYDTKPKPKGVEFTINSNSGDFDITSSIVYKGLQIGEVLDKSIDEFTINYQVLIYDKYKYLISSQTKFYKINPLELKASLENLDIKIPSLKNMFSSAIGFVTPAMDEKIKSSYRLYDSKNDIDINNTANDIYSFKFLANGISSSDMIYYKGIIVGKVDKVTIENGTNIVYGHIKNKYSYLVNNSTVFYKQKAISSKISTDGFKIELSNLKELILGGVTFITPNTKEKLTSKIFTFYDDIDKFYEKDTFTISLLIEDNYNIKKTSKLLYRNIEIGTIKNITLDKSIKVDIQIKDKYKYLFGNDAKIYLQGAKISLEKIENLSSTVLGDNLYLISDKNNGFKSRYALDSVNPYETYYEKGL
ncbi:MAG: MlaD family protein, partial [Arcobacteraceae bacterium]